MTPEDCPVRFTIATFHVNFSFIGLVGGKCSHVCMEIALNRLSNGTGKKPILNSKNPPRCERFFLPFVKYRIVDGSTFDGNHFEGYTSRVQKSTLDSDNRLAERLRTKFDMKIYINCTR